MRSRLLFSRGSKTATLVRIVKEILSQCTY